MLEFCCSINYFICFLLLLLSHSFGLCCMYNFSFEHADIMTFTFHVRICCDGCFCMRTFFHLFVFLFGVHHLFNIALSLDNSKSLSFVLFRKLFVLWINSSVQFVCMCFFFIANNWPTKLTYFTYIKLVLFSQTFFFHLFCLTIFFVCYYIKTTWNPKK